MLRKIPFYILISVSREHNILQAIARVNRLYDGKENGFIIDYRGIFGQLNDAIELYKALEKEGFDKEDIIGSVTNVLEEIKNFLSIIPMSGIYSKK